MKIASVIARTIEELPEEVREALGEISIVISSKPSAFHRSIGIAEDQMAVFVRAEEDYGEENGRSWIFLFTDNIQPMDEERVTLVFLHELAHALGMDEHEVRGLGLGPEVLQCH